MIYHLSCAELTNEIPAGSVDFIITDPPYSREFIPCWSELADFAVHALKPGGSLVALSGIMFLPDVLLQLDKPGLEYWWTLNFDMLLGSSPGNWVWPRRLNQYWKPILWYRRSGGDNPELTLKSDYVSNGGYNGKDKRFHKWSQMNQGTFNICQRFARPGDLIVDPFVGGGTTAIAALSLGCDFIGADIDAEAVEITRLRMLEYQPVMPGV